MKYILKLLLILSLLVTSSFAKDVKVKGHFRKDGTYVQPHYRTAPNGTKWDNYSTKGNINPYTGKEGTKDGGTNSRSYTQYEIESARELLILQQNIQRQERENLHQQRLQEQAERDGAVLGTIGVIIGVIALILIID